MTGAVAARHVEVRLGELAAARQRRAGGLGAADEVLLVAERLPVPDLDGHVEPAGDEVGAAGQPVAPSGRRPAATQTCSSTSVGLLGLDVRGAVLEAEQVARRRLRGRGGRGTAEAELRPADRDRAEADPGQVADRVHRDLRVVGARLDAEVAVRALGVEHVGGEVRQRRAAPPGCRSARPKRSLPSSSRNSAGPEPEGDRQPAGGQADRLAGVVGRQVGWRPRSARPAPARLARGSSAPRPRSTPSAARPARSRTSVVTSNAAKCSRSWAGVTMPAWCSPRKA